MRSRFWYAEYFYLPFIVAFYYCHMLHTLGMNTSTSLTNRVFIRRLTACHIPVGGQHQLGRSFSGRGGRKGLVDSWACGFRKNAVIPLSEDVAVVTCD
jgi:hypothetical protein